MGKNDQSILKLKKSQCPLKLISYNHLHVPIHRMDRLNSMIEIKDHRPTSHITHMYITNYTLFPTCTLVENENSFQLSKKLSTKCNHKQNFNMIVCYSSYI